MKVELLDVLRKIMECSNVSMKVFSSGEHALQEFVLYRMLYGDCEYEQNLSAWISAMKEAVFYCYQDTYDISYCIATLPTSEDDSRDILLLGPFMEYAADEEQLSRLMSRNHVPSQYGKEMREYYNAVPVIPQADRWREMCRELFALFYPGQTVRTAYFLYDFSDLQFRREAPDNHLSAAIIEMRYAIEEKLMSAIENGDTTSALKHINEAQQFRLAKRYPDSLREIRNGLIVANTIYRKAAQAGGVHPVHIDTLSAKLARYCEKVMTYDESFRLTTEMVRQYCLLVQNYSLRGHSSIIQKVVNYINLNLAEKLSLALLAEQNFINPSYLSTLFKKEMGLSLSAYINQQRIRLALRLFNTGSMQVQDVAARCGIEDTSYFRKLFKKSVGMTPSAYLSLIHSKIHNIG